MILKVNKIETEVERREVTLVNWKIVVHSSHSHNINYTDVVKYNMY